MHHKAINKELTNMRSQTIFSERLAWGGKEHAGTVQA